MRLPPPALPVQPYYASLGLAACGCLPQPLGAEVAAITVRSRQRERATGGPGRKRLVDFLYVVPYVECCCVDTTHGLQAFIVIGPRRST
jgi:hypothetical protein